MAAFKWVQMFRYKYLGALDRCQSAEQTAFYSYWWTVKLHFLSFEKGTACMCLTHKESWPWPKGMFANHEGVGSVL